MIKKKSANLSKRYQSSYETKDSGGAKTGVMDWGKVDGEVSFFKPVEGKNRINIIPYTIKSKNHPLVRKGDFEIGDSDYVMDVYVHRSIGPSEASVICLKSTYGKPCPICEQSALLIKQGKEKEGKDLRPKRRVFYNVQDLKEPEKVKIFETSHNLFEKELIDEARNDDDDGGFVNFADPAEGKEIKFRASEASFNKTKYLEFKSFSFVDRDYALPDDLLESAVSFDEIMRVPTYEEVEKILYGQEDDEDDEAEEKPAKSARKPSKDDDEDDEAEEEKPKGKKKPVDDDEDDEPEDDEPPKPKKPAKDESDDDDEAEEEKPKPKRSAGKCPFGHAFGKDTDAFEECDDCDCWDKCMKAGR